MENEKNMPVWVKRLLEQDKVITVWTATDKGLIELLNRESFA
ncbi:predicted protein [Sclerotinia sclerotiorum 1980 UF-70]|uniref:Uncharacterized protein n=1 Tax=Sclerotinia sclerotiorum (strain ATCC 18683 / 1980 / Ss-1) TaxID=665079 RepID=A7EZH1_SCLS1|nr:predicted protein [Sclerotinia sclerotiorum 1980 UF-70]EDN94863.1 predicted protein [Sclerotinia sclerotiorum 1980 UF-70]